MIRVYLVFVASLLYLNGCSQEPPVDEEPLPAQTQVDTTPADLELASDEAKALIRRAQALMKEGKRDKGYETAEKAMSQLVTDNNNLAWLLLETFQIDDKRVDVHFNMGELEREIPDDGIVTPLSFRIVSENDPELSQVIDFEIGRMRGESIVAAIDETKFSKTTDIEIDASYETIRQRVIDIVRQR